MKLNSPHFDKYTKFLISHQSKVEYTPQLRKKKFKARNRILNKSLMYSIAGLGSMPLQIKTNCSWVVNY